MANWGKILQGLSSVGAIAVGIVKAVQTSSAPTVLADAEPAPPPAPIPKKNPWRSAKPCGCGGKK